MITLAAVILLLPGCSSLTPASTEHTSTPEARATPQAEETKSPPEPDPTQTAASFSELTFAAGADLDPDEWSVQWDDRFQADAGFSVLSPDDGNGSWSYVDDANGCAIMFYQGMLTDVELTDDDQLNTDRMLTALIAGRIDGVTLELVQANTGNDTFLQRPQEGTVSIRSVGGTSSDGGTWIDSARMFGTLGMGNYVHISCPPGQDANVEREKLRADHLILIVVPM